MCRWGQEIYTAPPTAATPNTPAAIRKIRLPIPSSTLFFFLNRHEYYDPYHEALANILLVKKTQKILLMRKSSHLLSWRDVVLDWSVGGEYTLQNCVVSEY